MVTVSEYESKIQERSKSLAQAKTEVGKFDPKIKRTQTGLRQAGIQLQAKVKGLVSKREKAKQQALQKIETEIKVQQELEKKLTRLLRNIIKVVK